MIPDPIDGGTMKRANLNCKGALLFTREQQLCQGALYQDSLPCNVILYDMCLCAWQSVAVGKLILLPVHNVLYPILYIGSESRKFYKLHFLSECPI